MADHEYDDLARELVALGHAVDVPAPDSSLATAVLERLPDGPVTSPAGTGWRRHRRIVVVVVAVLLGVLLTPPVRAAVADWFGFGGVRVELGDTEAPTTDVSPPAVSPEVSLAEAAS